MCSNTVGKERGAGIAALLASAIERGASDLHLSAGQPPLIRVDGEIAALENAPLDSQWIREAVDEVAPDAHAPQGKAAQERDFSFELPEVARFRVNAFEHHRGAGAAFRALPLRVLGRSSTYRTSETIM